MKTTSEVRIAQIKAFENTVKVLIDNPVFDLVVGLIALNLALPDKPGWSDDFARILGDTGLTGICIAKAIAPSLPYIMQATEQGGSTLKSIAPLLLTAGGV